jgi:DNA-binding NarL/FixJ family response regulator
LSVILVTGDPSSQSAIQSIQLPVVAYLVKPFDFDDLHAEVQSAIVHAHTCRTVRSIQQRLQGCYQDLEDLSQLMRARSGGHSPDVDAFIALTMRNFNSCLVDLRHLGQAVTPRSTEPAGRPPSQGPQQAAPVGGLFDSDVGARASQLEQALSKIANTLEEAGILARPYTSLLQSDAPEELRNLSSREKEVLHRLQTGQRVPTIARSFYLSPHTVRNHLKSIFRKLGVRSQTELLEWLGRHCGKR